MFFAPARSSLSAAETFMSWCGAATRVDSPCQSHPQGGAVWTADKKDQQPTCVHGSRSVLSRPRQLPMFGGPLLSRLRIRALRALVLRAVRVAGQIVERDAIVADRRHESQRIAQAPCRGVI